MDAHLLNSLSIDKPSRKGSHLQLAWPLFLGSFTLTTFALTNGFGQEKSPQESSNRKVTVEESISFEQIVAPHLNTYCRRCHDMDEAKSGFRIDLLSGTFPESQLAHWNQLAKQLKGKTMPPPEEPQPSESERRELIDFVERNLKLASARPRPIDGSVRRLTVSQYRNTLRELLGIEEDLAQILPPEGLSKDGFANHSQVLGLTPLQMEYYLDIADKALSLTFVDGTSQPTIQNWLVRLGKGINTMPCSDSLILGANSLLLNNSDFEVKELTPEKNFPFKPFRMQGTWNFIEGYDGNNTVRGMKTFSGLYHSVFACMRGSEGYPKGLPYEMTSDGILLRPAIPSAEIFGVESTYGPKANFKISLRELPESGRFRVRVLASRFDDALLLEEDTLPVQTESSLVLKNDPNSASGEENLSVTKAGIYQLDVVYRPTASVGVKKSDKKKGYDSQGAQLASTTLFTVNGRPFSRVLAPGVLSNDTQEPNGATYCSPVLHCRLPAGSVRFEWKAPKDVAIERLVWTPLGEDQPESELFRRYESRVPYLGLHMGLRRDCGSTLKPIGVPKPISDREIKAYDFEGAINNFPKPYVEKENVNYLAGVHEIGVRSEYTDGRDLPRLLIHSIEFEGPYWTSWPTAEHQRLMEGFESARSPVENGTVVLKRFMTKAFRRPVTQAELQSATAIFHETYRETSEFIPSLRDAMQVVLTSPQFLFLVEKSNGPEPEPLDNFELASKLSYFLWDSPPDDDLWRNATNDTLRQNLKSSVDRMIDDPKFARFLDPFVSQWLSLDKLDTVEVDMKRHPKLTRDMKSQLRREPIETIRYCIANNCPVENLIRSDIIVANDAVATYYGLGTSSGTSEAGFSFLPMEHRREDLGGLLTQAGILAGLSNGRESNPVKRGAWFARKFIAEPPDDPPPNVPQLQEEEASEKSLRERLEQHRNQEGCIQCHRGIDPWGVALEGYDAGGLRKERDVDTRVELPDGTEVTDVLGLKRYLIEHRLDQVRYSFVKHLMTYALGRTLSYNEASRIREMVSRDEMKNLGMRDLFHWVVQSKLFLEK